MADKTQILTLTPTKAKGFLKEVKDEMAKEEGQAFKEFVKGVYRYSEQLKKEALTIQTEVDELESSIEKAGNGDWSLLAKIKIPARFFSEGTLRKHGHLDGGSSIKFADLYKKSRKK